MDVQINVDPKLSKLDHLFVLVAEGDTPRQWRALEKPSTEVFFPQDHAPGSRSRAAHVRPSTGAAG